MNLVDRCENCGRLVPSLAKRGEWWLRQCPANYGYCRPITRSIVDRLAKLARYE